MKKQRLLTNLVTILNLILCIAYRNFYYEVQLQNVGS